MSVVIVYGILAIVFAFVEYWTHKEYHSKHPDYAHCGSGIIGYIILAVGLIVYGFTH